MFKKKTRVISLLCVILMILTFISTCIVEIDISNSNKVYADSNDNRKLNLAIAEGKTRAEISEAIANDGGGLVDRNRWFRYSYI